MRVTNKCLVCGHASIESMRIAAKKAGLQIEGFRTLTSSEWLLYQWIHLFTFPPAGEPSPFWSPRGSKNLKTRLVIAFLSARHRTKLNHILTRLFDALGCGDNYLFLLKKV